VEKSPPLQSYGGNKMPIAMWNEEGGVKDAECWNEEMGLSL
jgi:hypothetical protein